MKTIIKQFEALCNNTNNKISMLANASAFLNDFLDDINWVGFYLFENNELVLGPFQGKVACTNIGIGKGVCGTSFESRKVLNIRNVHEFPGHIACDSRSNSEIVLPIIKDDFCFGVLDIDSESYERFSIDDENILKEIVSILANNI